MYTSPEDIPIMIQYIEAKAMKDSTNDRIRNAKEIVVPHIPMTVLNPIFSASLTPKERTELVARPIIGKIKDIVVRFTFESNCLR
jgi:hypothetical protein